MHALAHRTAVPLLTHMCRTYAEFEPHTIWECYNPEKPEAGTDADGDKLVRRDFCGWSALGPISIYLENVLGFHTVDALQKRVEWERPTDLQGQIGVRGLRFGEIVTDIVADGARCRVRSNGAYTLVISGRSFNVQKGENEFSL